MKRPGRLRSLLFAPAVRPDFLAKLAGRGADAVVIDCEDATPPGEKEPARRHAREATRSLAADTQVTVRINAIASTWFVDDVHGALSPELTAVVVPKIESTEGLDSLTAELDRAGLTELGVIAGIETALGVADARPLLAHPRVVGAYFGAEDLIADIGGVRTSDNAEVATARSLVVLAGRLAGVPVLDQVVTDFRDDERFTREATEARALGYAGKMCIHPGQVDLAHRAFTPTADEADRARRLIDAYDAGVAAGRAAIDFEGQMVDGPVVAQARRVLAAAD